MQGFTVTILIHPLHRASTCQRCGLVGEIYCGQFLLCRSCAEELVAAAPPVEMPTKAEPRPKARSLLDMLNTVLRDDAKS